MLAVGVGLASLIMGLVLRDSIRSSFSRMGADLVVVPRRTLVNLTSSLLTVQPTGETMEANLATALIEIPGVSRVAPQRMVSTVVEGQRAKLIAFDPEQDFTVLNWIHESAQQPVGINDLLAGGSLPGQAGESLSICGQSMQMHGRLGKTGVGPFDESYFITFAGLTRLAQLSTRPQTVNPMQGHSMPMDHDPGATTGTIPCLPDFVKDRITAFLLQLSPTARIAEVKFAISRYPELKVVEGNGVLISSRQGLHTLFIGIIAFAALLFFAVLILVSLLFSAIVQERYREVGLLRAMGAKPHQVMTMILAEAGMITGLGGLAGLVFGATLLFVSARSFGYYFDSLGVPFTWPPPGILATACATMLMLSTLLGLVGALLPAWRAHHTEPFTLIHAGGR